MPVNTIPQPSTTTPSLPARPVYFWRPFEEGTGYLGQWYSSPFTVDGDTYATCEMWMMVQKARLFGDEDVAKDMLKTRNPKAHKALGRQVKKFNNAVWDENKFEIVVEGNMHKFSISQDAADMKRWLLETGDRELVEASPMDRIWGIGFAEKNAGANRHRWGQNLLGKALMVVRTRLREEEATKKKRTLGDGAAGAQAETLDQCR